MELAKLLNQLNQTLDVPVTTATGEVTAAVFGQSHSVAGTLSVSATQLVDAQGRRVATLSSTTPIAALETIGEALYPVDAVNAAVMPVAVSAITASFATTLAAAAKLLAAPLMVLDLTGQRVLQASSAELDAGTTTGRFLSTHRPALDPHRFWHHLYITLPSQSPVPLLLTPLTVQQAPLAYLAVGATSGPLTAKQTQLLQALAPIIANAAVKDQIVTAPASGWDRLLNLLLTEQYDQTFAAQFARAGAVLPKQMVLLRAQPTAGQSDTVLRTRLQQLLAPMVTQVIVTNYRHLCLALVTVSLPEYNSAEFRQQLATVATRANCQLIVSTFYMRPGETVAAYQVLTRTARLAGNPSPVTFCEDRYFALMLAEVNDRDNILPYFLNPAIKALQAYDTSHHAALVPTLRAYLAAGGKQSVTAANLYIHPNTLRERLERITTLTGVDLKAAATQTKLTESFEVLDYLKARRLE